MCMGGASAPAPPPPPPPPAPPKEPVKFSSTEVQKASDDTRKQLAAAGATQGGTLLTGGQGVLTPANTEKNTLLGS